MRFLILTILVSSSTVFAHQPDELVTLRAANDALTLRVAELLQENARLQEFTEKALVAQSKGETVSRGCDPQGLRKSLVEGDGYSSHANSWLKENAINCSKSDLEYIRVNVGSWSGYDMSDTRRLATYYADQK
jgi:hypothetical protein